MAKKTSAARKPSGAAAIQTIEDELDVDDANAAHELNGSSSDPVVSAAKPRRNTKAKPDQQPDEHFGVSDVKKAAAFVNSIGGLDKAIAVLQILKVAKEVQ